MKKLIIAMVAVAVAAVSQAGTVLWSTSETFSNISGTAYTEATSPIAYLFDADTLTQDALVKSWLGGTTSLSSAKTSASWYDAYEMDVSSAVGDTGTKNLYWAVVNGDDLFVSSAISQEISDMGNTAFAWSDESVNVLKDQAGFTSAGWYKAPSSPTPEPTSGLLLLVGMAGLALRRRRA